MMGSAEGSQPPPAPLRVGLVGATGRMGRALLDVLSESPWAERMTLVAAWSASPAAAAAGSVAPRPLDAASLEAAAPGIDVVIDFSVAPVTPWLAGRCAEHRVALVSGTTGMDAQQHAQLDAAAARIPLLWAPNMSPGVNLMLELVKVAGRSFERVYGEALDIEMVESHHRAKLDAPSGTALRLGQVVAEAIGRDLAQALVFDRANRTGARTPGSIGVSVVRAGDIAGEHTVIFAADGERLEVTHRATDRRLFARGALGAAHWLVGQAPGHRYDMGHVLGLS